MIALLFTIRALGNRFGRASDAARHHQFIGRTLKLELFRFAIAAPKLPFHVLHTFGLGSVGKTSLLGEVASSYEQVQPPGSN